MEIKRLAHKLSAVGSLLGGGSTVTALMTQLPPGTPDSWEKTLHLFAIGTVILGFLMSAAGKIMMGWEADEQAEVLGQVRAIAKKAGQVTTIVLLSLSMLFLNGCKIGSESPSRQAVIDAEEEYTEAAWANDDAQYDQQEKALKAARERIIAMELKESLALEKSKTDPTESARLYALAEQRRREFADVQKRARDLREKNIKTNREGARRAANSLRKPPANTPADLTPQIQSVTGNDQPKATLLDAFSK